MTESYCAYTCLSESYLSARNYGMQTITTTAHSKRTATLPAMTAQSKVVLANAKASRGAGFKKVSGIKLSLWFQGCSLICNPKIAAVTPCTYSTLLGSICVKYVCNMQCMYIVCAICVVLCNRESWTALGPAMQALSFDFYDAEANMKPSEVTGEGYKLWPASLYSFIARPV